MKIFLSWSGDMSHQVACALRDWLPYVIQSLKPFISSEDINKGTRWSDVLAKELSDTQYGIICITPYNLNAPWLNFEAGALSKFIDRSFVSPFLFHVNRDGIKGPLSQFQSTIYSEEDILNLLTSINNRLDDEARLDQQLLEAEFKVWWEKLKILLDNIPDNREAEVHDGYTWLYTLEEVLNVEAQANIRSIWVITPDIYEQTLASKTKDILLLNLGRGITYRFITRNSSMMDGVVEELQSISTDSNKLAIKDIPDEEFRSQAVTDYIIINPEHGEHDSPRAFLRLPVTEGGFWILVDEQAAIGFTDRFRKMWNREEVTK
jgi:hypothetical protein